MHPPKTECTCEFCQIQRLGEQKRELEARVEELENAIREHAEVVRDTLHAGEDIDRRLWSILEIRNHR